MFARRNDEHRDGDQQRHHARPNPELLPVERPVNQRSGNELARGPTEHADALGNSDCGREVPRWETMGGEIDSRDK
jgi:hypothetical protein